MIHIWHYEAWQRKEDNQSSLTQQNSWACCHLLFSAYWKCTAVVFGQQGESVRCVLHTALLSTATDSIKMRLNTLLWVDNVARFYKEKPLLLFHMIVQQYSGSIKFSLLVLRHTFQLPPLFSIVWASSTLSEALLGKDTLKVEKCLFSFHFPPCLVLRLKVHPFLRGEFVYKRFSNKKSKFKTAG